MQIRNYFILVVIFLVACSTVTESPPTALPEPTTPPEPTATPTELVATEIPPSPTPVPTDTPPATPTQIPTVTSPPIQFNFTWHEGDPILNRGDKDEWDYLGGKEPRVVLIDDVFHMFYTGVSENTIGIGYAQSTDGLEFTKHDANPIYQSDSEGFDANGIAIALPLVVEDNWMLYYGALASSGIYNRDYAGTSSIGLTTAPEPTGPWTPGQQVLSVGRSGEWDSSFITPASVIKTEDGYLLYYGAVGEDPSARMMCGLATSPDGVNWTKYDDPSTTEAPFAESDPIIEPSDSGWDSFGVYCSVLNTDSGWEMFYEGFTEHSGDLGYAVSQDGIHWSKYQEGHIMDARFSPSTVKFGPTYYIYMYDAFNDLLVGTGTIDRP